MPNVMIRQKLAIAENGTKNFNCRISPIRRQNGIVAAMYHRMPQSISNVTSNTLENELAINTMSTQSTPKYVPIIPYSQKPL